MKIYLVTLSNLGTMPLLLQGNSRHWSQGACWQPVGFAMNHETAFPPQVNCL